MLGISTEQFLNGLLNLLNKSAGVHCMSYLDDKGNVARFVFQKRDLFPDGRPKPKVFQPEFHPELNRFETSVCGLNGVTEDRVWFLGRSIRKESGLTAIAAVHVEVPGVVNVGLRCEGAPEPNYAEHVVIVGWNVDPEAKHERLLKQTELAGMIAIDSVHRTPI